MLLQLHPHPDNPGPPGLGIGASVRRVEKGELRFTYTVSGPTAALAFAPLTASARQDELWRRTCFEAFVRQPNGMDYVEFNFAPSLEFAVYRFNAYRHGMAVELGLTPQVTIAAGADWFRLEAQSPAPFAGPLEIGLSAVALEQGGGVSYWALSHPAAKPDFHHPNSYLYALPEEAPP
jgi:hypothetical protein